MREDLREGIVNLLRIAMAGNDKLDGKYHMLIYETANEILSYLKSQGVDLI